MHDWTDWADLAIWLSPILLLLLLRPVVLWYFRIPKRPKRRQPLRIQVLGAKIVKSDDAD